MSLDSIITALGSNIIPVITTIITGTVSIIGIIIAHHLKVRQEIAIRRKIELFDRKQKAYRNILKIISKIQDHSYFVGSRINWKITRHMYDEILLIGSKEVIEKTNEIISDKSPDSQGTDKKIKNLWNAIRKDLYGEEIALEQMHMIRPAPETLTALKLHNKHSGKLKSFGIDTPEKARDMDIATVSKETEISTDDLDLIKKMAEKELEYEKELKQFLEDE